MGSTEPELAAIDTDALNEAAEVLRDAGFRVIGVRKARRYSEGIEFDLKVQKSTRLKKVGNSETEAGP